MREKGCVPAILPPMAIRKALLTFLTRMAAAVRSPAPSRAPAGVRPDDRPEGPAEGRAEDPGAGPVRPLEVDTPVPGSVLLDIREPAELAGGVAPNALLIPMDCVPHQLDALDRSRPITVYCAAGARSLGVAHWLREQGFDAVSLAGGLQSLSWGPSPVALRTPNRAGEPVVLGLGATIDGVPVGPGTAERVDGDRVRILDQTGLQMVGELRMGR
ncbi:MAG: hypothetical protein EXR69_04305 [Myxococcales bacterium]|nr:hypothetical protein [Myxococcales bacterium]